MQLLPATSARAAMGTSNEAALNNQLYQDAAAQQMYYQTQSAERAMQFNAEQARLDREWQERMSSTAYQRMVGDLKKAGLNPILAYTNGPASTPGGSSASGYAQSGALANVDTFDWKSNQKQAAAAIMNGTANLIGSSAKMVDSIASLLPGKTFKVGF